MKKYRQILDLNKINRISNNIVYLDTLQNDLKIKKSYDTFYKNRIKIPKKSSLIEKSKSSCSSMMGDMEESAYSEKDEKIYKKNINKLNTISMFNNRKNKKTTSIPKKNERTINYSFNVFEIFLVTFCYKCIKGNLKLKNELNNKAKELLYYKLDIHIYLRNMFLFDIINQTIIDGKKKNIINLLSRPVISINNKEKEEEEIFYQNYKKAEFDKFFEGLIELSEKKDKEKKEEKLIILANKRLKEIS